MGPGGLYVFVLLGLLMVASEENKGDVTRCWTKGKEVTLGPHECPAEFAGADAKFCCRLCYGANCCLPRRPRVNLNRCPPESRLAEAYRDYTPAPDPTTAAPRKLKFPWLYILFAAWLLLIIIVSRKYCCKRFWDTCWPICKREGEETQARVRVQPSRILPLHPRRPDIVPDRRLHPYTVPEEDPPPYSLVLSQITPPLGQRVVHPQGADELPPPYPGSPVVAFQRSHSRGEDDTVVILPRLVAPPEEAASASAPGGVLPREAVTGSASEETGLPEAAASSSASKVVDLDSGAPDPTE